MEHHVSVQGCSRIQHVDNIVTIGSVQLLAPGSTILRYFHHHCVMSTLSTHGPKLSSLEWHGMAELLVKASTVPASRTSDLFEVTSPVCEHPVNSPDVGQRTQLDHPLSSHTASCLQDRNMRMASANASSPQWETSDSRLEEPSLDTLSSRII